MTHLEDLSCQQHVDPGEMEEAHDHDEPHPRLNRDVMPALGSPVRARLCKVIPVEICRDREREKVIAKAAVFPLTGKRCSSSPGQQQ